MLEFGVLQPMVDYLHWLESVLVSRGVPAQHLPQSLDWLAEFFAVDMEETDAAAVVTALHRAKAQYLNADAAPALSDPMMVAPEPWPDSEAFEKLLLAGDRRGAESILDGCFARGQNLVDAELHVIQPALYGIGRKWQNNQVTVAQEHLATAIAQSAMTRALVKSELPSSNGRTVLLACVAGNIHSLGLQMVADAFQLAGWEVQYLGANVPTGALVEHLARRAPDLLGLSVSFAQQLPTVRDIVSRMEQAQGAARPAVMVGGLAINRFSRLAGALGADAWSPDARSAVASAGQLPLQPA